MWARRLLKSGRARIYQYRLFFTLMIVDHEDGVIQEVEYKSDTGYQHVGISVCSKKHEFVREQRDMLTGEPEKHNDQRKYRRARRNRKSYRRLRFDNRISKVRKAEKDGGIWLAPPLEHKVEVQARLFTEACKVIPVTSAVFEMEKFDPALMKTMETGAPVPKGEDYQHGERYRIAALRAAVSARDHHTCIFCGRVIRDHAILHVHHIGFWKKDRTGHLGNLAVCSTGSSQKYPTWRMPHI
jgi:hypothetical protein